MNLQKSPTEQILDACLEAGACAAGVAEVTDLGQESSDYFGKWLEKKHHASMGWLDRYHDIRRNPAGLLDGARTIISCAFSYGLPENATRHPLFSEYALGEDYHEIVRNRLTSVCETIEKLFPDAKNRICVDTAPLHERLWAKRAGIGFIGRNGMLIVPGVGSKVFLGEIVTTAHLTPTSEQCEANCGECELCVRNCPGKALDGTGQMDARKCYSYHTIENRDEFLPDEVNLRGRLIYGCDVCQNVCPFNKKWRVGSSIFSPRAELEELQKAEDVESLTHEAYVRIFRGSSIRRAKPAQLARNATHSLRETGRTSSELKRGPEKTMD